ncbi:MAG: restriction endonuclease subunit S [Clostridium sp.]|nr:restriction endonuclease subunit S [Clostridium sp.]
MSKVKLGEVAIEHKEACKGSKDGYPIVGLEHLIPEEVTLTAWDEGSDNTFIKMFRKGNVLFGRRRAYLKKAAVAPFDGICSGDITVIEAIPDRILPELLPFIIQNDELFDFAVGKSAGSLSPRVKWGHLKNYEFELPDMDKQRELAELLWAMDATKKSYQKLIAATDELVKSQFMEQFSMSQAESNGWSIVPVSSVVIKPLSGEWGQEDTDGTGVKVLRTTNFTDSGFIDYTEVVRRSIELKKVEAKALRDGDILIEKSGGSDTKPVGRVVFYQETSENFLFNNFTALLRPNTPKLNSRFLFTFLFVTYWNGGTKLYENKTTGIHNLKLADYLDNTMIPIPPIEDQEVFAAFVEQSDKSKFELEQALSELTATYKRIIAENLG